MVFLSELSITVNLTLITISNMNTFLMEPTKAEGEELDEDEQDTTTTTTTTTTTPDLPIY